MATEQDRLVTVVEVVDRYSKELDKMRSEFQKTTQQMEKTSKDILKVGEASGSGTDGLSKLVSSFFNLKNVMTTLAISAAINTIKEIGLKCIQAASDMKELENITTQVFEKSSEEIKRWADSIEQNVGRSIYTLQNYASVYGSMFKGAGFETDVFKEWSKDLTKLTADFSSFFNVADDEAFTAIKGVLTGETEAMKRYGFILNETTMAEYAHAHGIKEKWSNLSEAEKMQLRYNALMEKTAHIQGDAERTIDGYANQLKVAEAHMTNIAGALGEKMLPAAEGALHMFNGFAQAVENFVKAKNVNDYLFAYDQEKEKIEELWKSYEQLSKKKLDGLATTKDEQDRLKLYEQLASLYPDIIGKIGSEAENYQKVGNAISDVIGNLKEKILLQMNEDVIAKYTKQIKDLEKQTKELYMNLEPLKLEIKGKFGVDVANIFTEKVQELAENFAKTGFGEGELRKVIQEELDRNKFKGDKEIATDKIMNLITQSYKAYTQGNENLSKIESLEREQANEIKMNNASLENWISISQGNHAETKYFLGKQQVLMNDLHRRVEDTIVTVTDAQGNIIWDNIQQHLQTRAVISQYSKTMSSYINTVIRGQKTTIGTYEVTTNGKKSQRWEVTTPNGRHVFDSEAAAQNFVSATPNKAPSLPKNIGGGGSPKLKRGGGGGSKSKGGSGGSKKEEKNKWESQIESLTKSLKELQEPINNFRHQIEELNRQINEIEVEKAWLSSDYGTGKVSESFSKELEGLKKQYETALEARDAEAVQNLKGQIEAKEFQVSQSNFIEGMLSDVKKRIDELKFRYGNENEKDLKTLVELNEESAKLYNLMLEDLKKRNANGVLTDLEHQQEIGKVFNEILESTLKLKQYEKYAGAKISKMVNDLDELEFKHKEDEETVKVKMSALNGNHLEKLDTYINIIEQQRDDYIEKLVEWHRQLNIKNLTPEQRKRIEEQIQGLEEKIKGFVDIINNERLFSDLAQSMASLDFGDSLNENITKAIENKVIEVNKKNEKYLEVTGDITEILAEKVENLDRLVTAEDIEKLRNEIIDEQIKLYEEKNEAEKAEILRKIRFNNKMEELDNQLGKLGDIFSQLGAITGSKSMQSMGSLIGGIQKFGNTITESGVTSLGGFADLFKGKFNVGNWLKGAGIITSGIGVAASILNFGKDAKKKAKEENEQKRQRAEQQYASDLSKSEELIKAIKDLTNSLQEAVVKIIENIAENTSDKNIQKQAKYYSDLISTTGNMYNDNIVASGHSDRRKRKRLRKVTISDYSNFNMGFEEFFGEIWHNWKRDSDSLQKFYDQYVSLFNIDELRRRMGVSVLDKHNMEQVKKNFLAFIESMRVMESYAKSLPKNGVLASFEGINVSDVFQRRKEYEDQLTNIYKSMGRNPEDYKLEIIQKVNEMIQGDRVIVTAFEQVRHTTVEELSKGNKAIDGLAKGLENYFNNLRKNLSKVMYDGYFQDFEESYTQRFENIANKLADFRLKGGHDIKKFARENLSFEDLFLRLRSVNNINNDMKEVIQQLRQQARNAGLGEDIINSMFPEEKISEKASKIESALKSAMEKALDTSSYNQFTMSLGESIYQNVKDGLVEAFVQSSKHKQLMEKYFIDEEYKSLIDRAETFKEAYDIIKKRQDLVENRLKAEGLDFRGTDAKTGEYLGGMKTQEDYARTRIANEQASFNFNFNLENKGFLAVDELMTFIKKEVKQFLHKSKKEEV